MSYVKKFFAITLILAIASMARAFDFSCTLSDGNTIYFSITSSTTVKVVNPDWNSHTRPSGWLDIPSTVVNNGQNYSVTEIDGRAFSMCNGITRVSLPEGLTSIGTLAFMGCSSLADIDLPSTVTSIAVEAFNGTAFVGNAANWSDEGKTLYLGNYLLKVSTQATDSLVVRDSVVGIAGMAFYSCVMLDSIALPQSMRYIGAMAFAACDTLTSISLAGSVPPSLADNSFENTTLFTVYVPCGSLASYNANSMWAALPLSEQCADSVPPSDDSTDVPIPTPIPTPWPIPWPDVDIPGDIIIAIDSVYQPAPSVSVCERELKVSGVNGQLNVYDVYGRMVYGGVCHESATITLPGRGAYIVCSPGSKAVKLFCYK